MLQKNDLNNSKAHFEQALEILNAKGNKGEISSIYFYLAEIAHRQGNGESALSLLEKAHTLEQTSIEELKGETEVERVIKLYRWEKMAIILQSKSKTLMRLGDSKKAYESQKKAYEILKKTFGTNHTNSKKALNYLRTLEEKT